MDIKFTEKDILERGVEEIIEKSSLEKKLKSGKKLRVKFGIDPTSPDIHLGHTAPLWKLRQFQELGHVPVIIIGDYTATIGDPSGQSEERKPLTDKEVKKNMKNYIKQVEKVLNTKKMEIRYNSEWHREEGLDAVIQLARTATVQQLLKRADFRERIKKGGDLTFIELFYPLLQGYDSVKVKADIEIGGTDQKFNLLMGRQVQSRFGQVKQDIMTLPLLLGTDGIKKMSKTFDNYISLSDKPFDMFGKVMSVTDAEILQYFELVTPLPFKDVQKLKKEKISGVNARDLKIRLATLITSIYWGDNKAQQAREKFETQFQKQDVPKDIEEYKIRAEGTIIDLLVEIKFAVSKSEARRLVKQGGVYIDDKRAKESDTLPKTSFILRIGRRKIARIVVE